MAKVNFTAGRIADFNCEIGKNQSFLWDTAAPGLGLRVTANGAKSYIFQSKLNGKTLRVTIGSPATWEIAAAQAEARRLKVIIDNGQDPRQVKADGLAEAKALRDAKLAKQAAMELQQIHESVTLGMVWPEYVAERSPQWSVRHALDHDRMMQAGGRKRIRSPKLTEPGPLASLANMRLVDLTTEAVDQWAKFEAVKRPARARLALRLLKAFLFWCARHKIYQTIITTNAAQSRNARESLGKAKVKHDVLQREQLPAWFAAVQQIRNPVISAYLRALLLTGARRNELATLRWSDVDFQWNSIHLHDKVDDFRIIPLTPYVATLLAALPRRNEWVFSSPTAASGHVTEPSIAHREACVIAGMDVTLHGLRRSFATLCEWTETPAGIAAQIQGHAPQGVREQNYIRRPLDLLRMWHIKIETWILKQAEIEFAPVQIGLHLIS